MSYKSLYSIGSTTQQKNSGEDQLEGHIWEKCKYSENCNDSTESSDQENPEDQMTVDWGDCQGGCREQPIQCHSKVKSELCRKFMEYGYCPYEDRCTFAHGPEELRQNQNPNTLYKTKKCFAFFGGGFCKYGERCNYLHTRTIEDLPKTEEFNRRKWRQILKNNRQIVYQGRPGSRLLKLLSS